MNDLAARLAALSPERQQIVLRRLRGEGWPVPLELRAPAEEVTSMPNLQGEVYLPPEITPAGPPENPTEPRRVLLTGATGFVGAFLLDELLRRTSATILCLVRSRDAELGMERIVQNLRSLAAPDYVPLDRIVAIPGDLEKARLSLPEREFDQLAAEVDCVVHNGAVVNFVCGYDALIGPNVVGTQEVLRFACAVRGKPLHYISTVGMFLLARHPPDRRTVPEDGRLEWGLGCVGGYAQSKWVAEALVQEAGRRGLPVVVHRVGHLFAHSVSGVSNPDDILLRLTKGCAQLGVAPRTDATTDIAPVDVFCRAVVSLARRLDSFGQVFHHLAPLSLAKCAREFAQITGRPIREVDEHEWRTLFGDRVARTPSNALYVLAPFLMARWPGSPSDIMTILARRPPIEFSRTRTRLAALGESYPPPEQTLRRSVEWLVETERNTIPA